MLSDAVKVRMLSHCVQARTIALVHRDEKAAAFYKEMAADMEAVMDHVAELEDEVRRLQDRPPMKAAPLARE